jgi:alcohol dehydrogenase
MKTLVYRGPGKKAWEEKPKPSILEPLDVLTNISKTTICRTDLHILRGNVPEVTYGCIFVHEGVDVVEEVGSPITGF